MPNAPLTIGQAADLLDLRIQKVFSKTSSPDSQYKKYFNYRTTEDYYDRDSSMSGLREADFVDENGVVGVDVPLQGFDQLYTQNSVDHMVSFSKRVWRFGIQKRKMDNAAKELKDSVRRKKERLCAERLDNGHESLSYTHSGGGAKSRTIATVGGDGLGAFDDDHTREDGGTNMVNIINDGTTYNLPLDYAGLKAAYTTMAAFVDPRGNPRPTTPTHIVVKKGSAAHFKAKEIKKAISNGKIPEEFSNDGSAVDDFEIIALDYLSNSAYWYAFDSARALTDEEGFQFVESEPEHVLESFVVYKTSEIQKKVESMFDLGHNDVARSWVGSQGDSSAPDS
jgi:hypothetical protein